MRSERTVRCSAKHSLQIAVLRLFVVLVVGFCIVCAATRAESPKSDSEQQQKPQRRESQFVPNLVQLNDRVYSGGLPEGDDAFAELKALGVKTIISVDGAKPDVLSARKFGLRYIHLPHGYDGIPSIRGLELAKAVRELEGPLYIHCHHGKHRSPAAATVACVVAGLLDKEQAVGVLQLAGTSPHYIGLYKAAAEASPVESSVLDNLDVEFVATAPIPPMAEAMVALERQLDLFKLISEAEWGVPAKHPDLVPAHQSLLFREEFTEMLRMDEVQETSADFKRMLRESEVHTEEMKAILNDIGKRKPGAAERVRLDQLLSKVSQQCKQCHTQFRDNPVSEH